MTALCSGKICTIFPEKGALNFWKACTIALEYSHDCQTMALFVFWLAQQQRWVQEPMCVRLVVVQTLMWDKTCIRTKIDGWIYSANWYSEEWNDGVTPWNAPLDTTTCKGGVKRCMCEARWSRQRDTETLSCRKLSRGGWCVLYAGGL